MKIDELSIDHNALRLIKDLELWACNEDTKGDENWRLMTLGYISGIIDMAEELKKVLHE